MTKLALFQGVSTPIADLARAIQQQGWQLGQVKWDNRLNAFTAEAMSPHGEKISKYGPDENTAVANALLAVTRRNHMRTTAQFKVGMWRTNFHERQREIAEAYRDAPIYDPKAVAAWKALGDDSMHRLHVLSGQLHIEPTNDPQPYKSADDMRKDVHEKRHYYLTQAGSAHPVWTSDQVAAFRAVHDILGHGVAGGHYDWPGRIMAASAHFPLLEPLAQQALFTEAVARPAYLSTYGSGPQKMALFPEFVEHHQQSNNPSAHRGIHPSQTTAPIGQAEGFLDPLNRTAASDSGPVTVWGEHVGTPEAIDAIRQNGFDLSQHKRGTWGRGVYVHVNGVAGTTTPGGKGGAKMPVQFTLNRPLHVALNYRNQIDDNDPGHQEFNRITGGRYHGTPEEKTAALQAAGYDGVVIHRPGLNKLEPHVAVAFDPASVQFDTPHFPYGYRTSSWGNTIDVNKGWESGVDPLPQNAYIHHGDPLQMKPTMDNASLIDTGWSKFQKGDGTDDRERMKLAIVNAFRVVLLSPRKDLRWNAIHYQDISNIPGGVDDPKVYWDTLENSRRRWNEAQGIDPNAHMIYFKFLKPFEARIAANHPEKGWEWAQNEAKQVLFNWWTEEQERIQEEDSKKPADKQRTADEIERRANEALARRLQLFLKPKDEHTDVEDSQMSMFGSDEMKRRYADLFSVTPAMEPNIHEAAGGQYNLLTGQEGLKYGAFMGTHLKAISQISQHADEILDAALEDVRAHDGEGHHFRQSVLALGVPGVGPKVCSFAWLLLQPMTSQLATIDTHMMDVLGHDYEKEMNNRDYFKFEREFRAGLDAAGYAHLPLGPGQWGMWDYKRTGPGSHQDHSAMRVLDPKPHQDVDWVNKAVNLKGETWLKQAPDWWQNTQPARDAVAQEWDNTYGKNFAQNQIPYQDLGSQVTASANDSEFHVAWKVPDSVLDTLHEWATKQEFGKVEDRNDLHMTAFYLPKGYDDDSLHEWIKNSDATGHFADPTLEFFPSQEGKGVAVVVRFNSDMGKKVGERLIDEAEEKGHEPTRFPGGYKPHITVAYADSEPEKVDPPSVSFDSSELSVSKPRKTSAVIQSYGHPFSYYWDRSMPVGSSLESKARTLAEHAKADKMDPDELEEWLADPKAKNDTRLSDADFKRFKNKMLKKLERLSKVASVQTVPSFIHPQTLQVHHGMPGQSLMEHARLQTSLPTQDVWRLLADEHVHKVPHASGDTQ